MRRLEAEAERWIDFEATLDPLLRFREYRFDETGGGWSTRLGLSAAVEFGEPPDTRARLLQSLERARHDLEMLRLDSVTEALLAHANLLEAQERGREARKEYEQAAQELAQADGRAERAADLEYRLAELEYREAQFELTQARSVARSYGLAEEAVYEPLRFLLPGPDVDPRHTHGYRMLRLQLLEAEAELEEARRSALDDLRLRTGYRMRGVEFELEGGLLNGEPGATIGIDLPGGVERWEVEISAQLVLTDDRHEIERLEQAVAAARAELEAYPELFTAELESTLVHASLAAEALGLAEEELALTGDSATSGLYRAWNRYLRAVAKLLEVSGGEWEVWPPGSS